VNIHLLNCILLAKVTNAILFKIDQKCDRVITNYDIRISKLVINYNFEIIFFSQLYIRKKFRKYIQRHLAENFGTENTMYRCGRLGPVCVRESTGSADAPSPHHHHQQLSLDILAEL
jgi:hypothetical protein